MGKRVFCTQLCFWGSQNVRCACLRAIAESFLVHNENPKTLALLPLDVFAVPRVSPSQLPPHQQSCTRFLNPLDTATYQWLNPLASFLCLWLSAGGLQLFICSSVCRLGRLSTHGVVQLGIDLTHVVHLFDTTILRVCLT
jgi:hypothetical protein